MATILQKTDLASSSFVNSNTLGAGGVKVNVGTGSDVKAAIDAAVAAGGGAASSVPASGVIAGALGAGVTTTPASVVGFNAAALAAVPDATDTIKGISALNQGTAAGDATNSTDALTATGLAAILNGTSPNTTPNALQAAVSSNPANYGTLGTALAPTAAPTTANPATVMVNSNGEVFRWNPTNGWQLSENGFSWSDVPATQPPAAGFRVITTFTAPRAGRVQVGWQYAISLAVFGGSPTVYANGFVTRSSAAAAICRGDLFLTSASIVGTQSSGHGVIQVAAGEVLQFVLVTEASIGSGDFLATVNYIA